MQPQRQGAAEILRIDEEGGPVGEELGKEPEGTVCGNCGREVPMANLCSHSVHCYRNNFRCGACQQVIAVREKEEHMKQWADPRRLFEVATSLSLDQDGSGGEGGGGDAGMDYLTMAEDHGVDTCSLQHPDHPHDTLMHMGARVADMELMTFVVSRGGEADPLNALGQTPLHIAAELGHAEAVRMLVEIGADLNRVVPSSLEAPLTIACKANHAQLARYLLEESADPDQVNALGDTALQAAQRLGYHDTVLALCTRGVSLRPGTPSRRRPAASQGGAGGGTGPGFGPPPIGSPIPPKPPGRASTPR